MSHHHAPGAPEHSSRGSLKVAFYLNLGFTLIEIVGGLLTNSVAILSDAVHDMGDSLSLGLAWYFDKLSKQGATCQNSYGYRRYSLLGGLITAVVLMVGLAFVLWNAIPRLFSPEEVNAPGMMLLALVGILFNGAAVLKVRRGTSLTEKVVSWHLLEDILGWVAVLVGAGIMSIWNLPIIDPLLSIAISIFVLWNVLRNVRSFFDVFLQKAPHSFDVEQFARTLSTTPKVVSVHHTHCWSIDGESHVFTTHLVMQGDSSREEVVQAKSQVRQMLDRGAFEHVTVDVELEGEECVIGDVREYSETAVHTDWHQH